MKTKNALLLKAIVREMVNNPTITETILAEKYKYSERTIRRNIAYLKKKGKIALVGRGHDRHWFVYK